jgi:hypothetical protein
MSEHRKFARGSESEYFRRLDAELIAQLKEERADRHKIRESESHKKHCSGCGHETVDVTDIFRKDGDEEHRILWTGVQLCLNCNYVGFPMVNLQRLVQVRDNKLQVLDLRLHMEQATKVQSRFTKKSA